MQKRVTTCNLLQCHKRVSTSLPGNEIAALREEVVHAPWQRCAGATGFSSSGHWCKLVGAVAIGSRVCGGAISAIAFCVCVCVCVSVFTKRNRPMQFCIGRVQQPQHTATSMFMCAPLARCSDAAATVAKSARAGTQTKAATASSLIFSLIT